MVTRNSSGDIGVARILSAGVHFFTTQQKLLKIDSCSGRGVHLVSCGGALTHFSCKLGLKKNFFHRPGGVQVHPLHPLATPMSGDEIANVNFLCNDVVHALKNTIDSCINSATDRFLQRRFTNFTEIAQCNGHYAVQGHSRSPILVPIESSYTTSY